MALTLVIIMALFSAGRGFAFRHDQGIPRIVIAGIVLTICHSEYSGTSSDPTLHDCCNECALGGSLVSPVPQSPNPLLPSAKSVDQSAPRPAGIRVTAMRTPRLSQGPPPLS
jgi:hypothetical protein